MRMKCWFSLAKKCSTVSEKIKIMTFMIERAKSVVPETGVYSKLKAYTGHLIDERTEKVVIEYYINDDFNCSRHLKNLHIFSPLSNIKTS